MKNKYLLTALAVVGFGVAAQASTIVWDFQENGTGDQGTSQVFTQDGYSLTAYGFTSANAATDLYVKNDPGGEAGLGIASDDEFEINTLSYVQLALTTVPVANLTSLFFGSVQQGETANIYYSTTLGSLGSLIGSVTSNTTFDLTSFLLSGGYIGVTPTGIQGYDDPNVLIASVTGTVTDRVPDGGTTVALLGGALVGLGLLKRKFLA